MATYKDTISGLTMNLPKEGEIFTLKGDPLTLYKRLGNQIFTSEVGTFVTPTQSETLKGKGRELESVGRQNLLNLGVNISQLPQYGAELVNLWEREGVFKITGGLDLSNIKKAGGTDTLGNITKTASPSNVYGSVLTSDVKGVISQSPQGGTTISGRTTGTRQVTLPSGKIVTVNEKGDIVSDIFSPASSTGTVDITNYKDSAAYKALPKDQKDLVDLGVTSFLGTPQQQQAFTDALTQAQTLADPYAKSQLALFTAEFQTSIARTNFDYNAEKAALERTRQTLAEDLISGREYLTLEQQADMARQLRAYDEDLLAIADQAAEKGLTFATGARSRALAEERRGTEYQDVIQSSRRKFNFQVKDLELRAARGDAEAAAKLNTIQGQRGYDLAKIGQSAERILGTANLPAIEGFTPTGKSIGQVEQERRKSILDFASYAIPK